MKIIIKNKNINNMILLQQKEFNKKNLFIKEMIKNALFYVYIRIVFKLEINN